MDQFLRTGATIDVFDSAALAALDASGLTLGTVVYVTSIASEFTLLLSDAALAPDEIVSVLGVEGYRWIKGAAGGGGPWDTLATQYASPSGNDTNDGTGWTTARKTMFAAAETVIASGGGTVYFAQGTEYGGPVPNQGLWLRNDDVAVPGFIQLNSSSIRFVGVGGNNNQFVFEPAGTVAPMPVADSQFVPQIWVVGAQVPVEFEFMKIYSGDYYGLTTPVRLGWDYARKTDYSLQWLNVTAASRAPHDPINRTTYTLDMSGANVWTVTQAQRVVDNRQASGYRVDLFVSRPATLACGEWSGTAPIHFVSTDPNFPSGNYSVERFSDGLPLTPAITEILLSWDDGQTTPVAFGPVTSATLITHGCSAGDKVSTEFTDPNFQTACMYTVVDVPAYNQITVEDSYGYMGGGSTASGTNIGKVVKQVRGKQVVSATRMTRSAASGFISAGGDNPSVGPTVDFGGSSAAALYLDTCYFSGGCVPTTLESLTPDQIDRDRIAVAVLGNAGGDSPNSTTIFARNCKSQTGSLRWHGTPNGGALVVNEWLQDSGGAAFPTLSIVNAGISTVLLDQIGIADSGGTDAVEFIGGNDPGNTRVGQTDGNVSGGSMVGPMIPFGAYNAGNQPNPWKEGRMTFWPGGIAAKHPGANRANGVVGARYANLAGPPSGWTGSGMSFSSVAAPDGSTTATRITASPGGLVTCQVSTLNGSFADGGKIVLGTWIKLADGVAQNQIQFFAPGSMTFDAQLSNAVIAEPMNFDGWQWVSIVASIVSAGDKHYQTRINVVQGVTDIWGLTAVYVPPDVPDADVFEYAATLKHQPYYLAAGQSGTMEGGKLIAHGGIGIDASVPKVAGVGSGQLTVGSITTYEPRYAADGTTVIGWAPLYAATVNP